MDNNNTRADIFYLKAKMLTIGTVEHLLSGLKEGPVTINNGMGVPQKISRLNRWTALTFLKDPKGDIDIDNEYPFSIKDEKYSGIYGGSIAQGYKKTIDFILRNYQYPLKQLELVKTYNDARTKIVIGLYNGSIYDNHQRLSLDAMILLEYFKWEKDYLDGAKLVLLGEELAERRVFTVKEPDSFVGAFGSFVLKEEAIRYYDERLSLLNSGSYRIKETSVDGETPSYLAYNSQPYDWYVILMITFKNYRDRSPFFRDISNSMKHVIAVALSKYDVFEFWRHFAIPRDIIDALSKDTYLKEEPTNYPVYMDSSCGIYKNRAIMRWMETSNITLDGFLKNAMLNGYDLLDQTRMEAEPYIR